MSLGVTVTTSETPQSGGFATSTGQAFIAQGANYGPEEPKLVRSLNEYILLYGPREAGSSKLYDAVNAYFALGGARAYINRIAGEGAPAAALLELEAGATAKTLVVTAKYKGTYGNLLKVEVTENESKTKTRLVVLNPEGEILEASGEYEKASELLKWGETHEAYVLVTRGSGYATGEAGLVKKLAATKLASGANPTVNEKATVKTIEGFQKAYGPGTLIVPLNTEEKVHTAMAEFASKTNRFAWADIAGSETAGTTAASLIASKGTLPPGVAGYIGFASSACTAAGLTLGTTRTIAGSAVVAGLCAQVSATGTINQAPAGREWSLAPFVTGFTNTYTESAMELLAENGINPFAERFGVPCLFDFVTALSRTKDIIFCQASAARERMALVAACEEVGERFLFGTLDGRHQKRAKFQGELQKIIKAHWEANSLYGETANEAGVANVAEPVNTVGTEQNGELNAELVVRISPYAEAVRIAIVSKPITESVS